MLRTLFRALALSVATLLSAAPAGAHHSAAVAYDLNKTVTVQGVITEVKWENPHTWIYLDVKDASGKAVKWGFEGKVPNLLIRTGITPAILKPGVQITISGHPARDAAQTFAEVIEVTFADGKTIKP
jgi:hypothetical protein